MSKPVLLIVTASIRPGRVGGAVGEWFASRAHDDGRFEVRHVDLAELHLPFIDEAAHPRLQEYEHAHTWQWSETVDAADAVVFVSPEYDYTLPASLLNAIQMLSLEWGYKPLALVTYGGISGGLRSAQTIRTVASNVGMYVVFPAVAIPFVAQSLDEGTFVPRESMNRNATEIFVELERVAAALGGLREERRAQEKRRPAAG